MKSGQNKKSSGVKEKNTKQAVPAFAAKHRNGAKKKGALSDGDAKAKGASAAGETGTRLALIKARHEAMKREIDQIREDLDSDEEA